MHCSTEMISSAISRCMVKDPFGFPASDCLPPFPVDLEVSCVLIFTFIPVIAFETNFCLHSRKIHFPAREASHPVLILDSVV